MLLLNLQDQESANEIFVYPKPVVLFIIFLEFTSISINQAPVSPVYLSACLNVLSVCLYICMYVCTYVCVHIHVSVGLSACLSVCAGYLCGSCSNGTGVTALLDRCERCSPLHGLLVAALGERADLHC